MNPDRPVAGLKEDGFNYYPLARQLAPHLLLSSGDPSLVAGIEAPWGSGKTSFLNLTKLALNSITTIAMVQLGKVYENLMVDLRASNIKLWERGARIVATLTGLEKDRAMDVLRAAEGHVKLAVVMHKRGVSAEEGRKLLDRAGGRLREAVE